MKLINFLKEIFTKKYWIDDFPESHPHPEYFMCNKTCCKGCEYL